MRKIIRESIRLKLLVIMLSIITIIIFVVFFLVSSLESSRAQLLQNRDAEQKAHLVINTMEVYANSMIGTAKDWGYWNETYDFVLGNNPEYLDNSVYIGSFYANQVNLAIYYDLTGTIKLIKNFDFTIYEEIEIEQNLLDAINDLEINQNTQVDYFVNGYILVDEIVYYIASSPIVNNDTGDISGNLIFGRLIDENTKDYIASITSNEFNLLESTISPNDTSFIEYTSDGHLIINHHFIQTLNNKQIMVEIVLETEIIDFVKQTILLMAIIILSIGSLVAIVSSLIINKIVFKRLIGLTNEIKYITRTNHFSSRVLLGSNSDEITSVAQEINFMLDKIKESEERITELAYTDHLTNIPNRLQFIQMVDNLIMESTITKRKFAILYLDLDNFKSVNDKYGHNIGDKLIVRFTQLLNHICKNTLMISRIGGDEFLILDPYESEKDLINLSRSIIDMLKQEIIIDEIKIFLTLSIGIARYSTDGTTVDELISKADQAMYDAKLLGKNGVSFYKKIR